MTIYEISPNTTKTAEPPRIALLFTLPVKEQTSKVIAPTKININPKFFNKPFMCMYFNRLLYSCRKEKHNSLTGEIICAKKQLFKSK